MFFGVRVENGKPVGPWIGRAQLPLFDDLEGVRNFLKREAPSEPWLVSNTSRWEDLFEVVTKAKAMGADSVAFVWRGTKAYAVPIDDVLEHLRDVLSGKHDGNPECSN